MLKRRKTVKILQGCENSQPANFAGCKISQHCSLHSCIDCFLTHLFVVLYKFALDVILVHLHIFVISLILSTYISSVKLVTSINFSVHQSINKIGHEASSPSVAVGFSLIFPSLSCTFSPSKHPLMMTNQRMLG